MLKPNLKCILLFVVLFLCSGVIEAKKVNIDSIRNVYYTSKDPVKRAIALTKIIVWYQIDYDSAYFHYKRGFDEFQRTDNKFGAAYAKHAFGIACVENAHYEDAKKYLNEAIALYEPLGNDSMIGKAKVRVAFAHYSQGDYEASIKTYMEAITRAQKVNDLHTQAWAYNLLGLVFYNKPNPDNKLALKYYLKSLDIYKKGNDLGSAGMVLLRIGSTYSKLKDDDNAIYYLNWAMRMGDSLDQENVVKWTLSAYSKYYMERNDYFKSNEIEKRAKSMSFSGGDYPGVVISYRNTASNNYNLKKYKEALISIDSALYFSLSRGVLQKIDELYVIKSDIHQKLGQTEDALFYYKKAVAVKDSLFSVRNSNNINELQTRFETKEKEKAIEFLNVEKENDRKIRNVLIIAFSIALFLIALVVFVLVKINSARKQLKLQKKEIEQQKQIVEAKQKEILDSISYARRIQKALMPSEKYFARNLKRNSDKN